MLSQPHSPYFPLTFCRSFSFTTLTNRANSYCQGLGMVAAFALLMMEEEPAFWLLQAILQTRRSDDYYGMTLLGAMADQAVLE